MKFKTFSIYICAIFAILLGTLNIRGAVTTPEFTVVIDAGHGGKDTGATDNGIREKDVNLGTALKLADYIRKNYKDIKVVLTRNTDAFISLQQRADIANRNKADLFISIHTNSVALENPNRKSIAGASTYTLGLHKDQDNLNVARRENSVMTLESDYNSKYKGFDPASDESYIIFEMAQKANLAQSVKFAEAVQKHLCADAGRRDRGVKQAGFWVLWATSMPSVLVELDFITNPDVAQFIGSEKGQEKMAEAIGKSVGSYFATLSSQRPQTRVSTPAKSAEAQSGKAKSAEAQSGKANSAEAQSGKSNTSGKKEATQVKRVTRPAKTSNKNKKENKKESKNKSGGTSSTERKSSNQREEASADYDVNLVSLNKLPASTRKETGVTSQAGSRNNDNSAAPRRRRGSKAREKSENREYEVAVVSEERNYLIAEEPVQEQLQESQVEEETNSKTGKNKKDKKSKESKKKDKQKKPASATSSNLAANNKTTPRTSRPVTSAQVKSEKSSAAVNNSGKQTAKEKNLAVKEQNQTAKENKQTATEKKSIGPKKSKETSTGLARLDKRVTVYKIQVLSSESHLKQNNPRFCGLKPIDCTKKGELYKYTYGETTSEAEIRSMLQEVKKLIPDAFIVTSQK